MSARGVECDGANGSGGEEAPPASFVVGLGRAEAVWRCGEVKSDCAWAGGCQNFRRLVVGGLVLVWPGEGDGGASKKGEIEIMPWASALR